MIEVGQKFGKYRLLDRLAVGGMAEIFKATTAGTDGHERTVAIKRLHRAICDDPELTEMLVDEARITVMLDHPNIAKVFDLGNIDGIFFIVMEYIDGVDCNDLLDEMRSRREFIPVPAALHIISETLGALQYAHRRIGPDGQQLAIVHRDVSPQNVMVGYDGEVRLVDFGIAKAKTRVQTTQAGVIKGKFYYMAPEQAVGGKIDARADIYSAAMVLYEMLTAVSPYENIGDAELLRAVRSASFPAPSYFRQDLDPELERIIMTALQKDPSRRFQSAHDFKYAIDEYARRIYPPVNHQEQMAHFLSNLFGRPLPAPTPLMNRQSFATSGESLIFEQPSFEALQQFRRDRDAAQSQSVSERTEVFDPARVRNRLAEYDQIKEQEVIQTMADIPSNRIVAQMPSISAVPSGAAEHDHSLFEVFSKPPGLYVVVAFVLFVVVTTSFILYRMPSASVQVPTVATAAQPAKATHLAVNSTPPNAEVSVDGKSVGSTPISIPVEVGKTYAIAFARPGYKSITKEYTVKDVVEPIEVKLEEAESTLKVSSFPAGAVVTIDGDEIGKSPLSHAGLEIGKKYTVVATLDGKTKKKSVVFGANDDPVKDLMFEFEKPPNTAEEIIVAAQNDAPTRIAPVRRKPPTKKNNLGIWGDKKKTKSKPKSKPKPKSTTDDDDEDVTVWDTNSKKSKKTKKKPKKTKKPVKKEGGSLKVW